MFNILIFIIPSCIFVIPFLVPSGPHMIVWMIFAFGYSAYIFNKILEFELLSSLFFGILFMLSPLAVKKFFNDTRYIASEDNEHEYESDPYRR